MTAETERYIATCLFDNAPYQVRLPTKTICDGVRVVDGHQDRINFIHMTEQAFSFLRITGAHNIERATAQFANDFRQSIEISGVDHPQFFWRLESLILDQRTGHIGFDKLFKRVLSVACIKKVGVSLEFVA